MKSSIFRERIYPVLFMFIITLFFISLTSGIYLSARDLVILNESIFKKKLYYMKPVLQFRKLQER